ncbi:MAG: hypothetical protein WDO14_01605 [Bacteroidota bacterium]
MKEGSLRRLTLALILCIPFIFYVGIALKWSHAPHASLTGDEPHYLIISKSIIDDFDLDIKNNYEKDSVSNEIIGPVDHHSEVHGDKEYSQHFPGLAILVAPVLLFFGVVGVKIFMCIITAVVTLLAFIVFRRQTNNDMLSAWAALGVTLALPFLAAGNEVYCEIVSGIVSCWSVLVLYRLIDGRPMSMIARVVWILCLSFLIVIHIKNILTVFVVTLIYLVIQFFKFRSNKESFKRILVETSIVVIPLITVLGFFIFERATGGGSVQSKLIVIDIIQNTKRFLMFHFDRTSGMFMQNPLLLIGLVGIIPFFIDSRIKALVWLAVYMPVAMLNSVVLDYFLQDGLMDGRFMWTYCVMWLIPFGYGLKYLKDNFRIEVINTIIVVSIVFQMDNLLRWIVIDPININWFRGALPVYDNIILYLPTFKLDHGNNIINALYLVGFALLILQGSAFVNNKLKIFPAAWIIYLVVFFVVMWQVAPKKLLMDDVVLNYGNMPASMGHAATINGQPVWVADEPRDGIVWFGPYKYFKRGVYEITYSLETEPLTPGYNGILAGFDASTDYGQTILNQRTITTSDADAKANQFKMILRLKEDVTYMEFRISKSANSVVRIREILVRNIDN